MPKKLKMKNEMKAPYDQYDNHMINLKRDAAVELEGV